MTEKDFRLKAQKYKGIACVYYPPRKRGQRPILKTLDNVAVGEYEIQHGRWTDGGSIPRIAHLVAHPLGYLFPAFLLHDTSLFDGYGWRDSNRRFAKAMRDLNAPAWQRTAILSAVGANGKWQQFRAWLGWSADYVD